MLYIYLRKAIKQVIGSTHPHLLQHKTFKHHVTRGSGRWVAIGLSGPAKDRAECRKLRYAYGLTAREAYLKYVALYFKHKPGDDE